MKLNKARQDCGLSPIVRMGCLVCCLQGLNNFFHCHKKKKVPSGNFAERISSHTACMFSTSRMRTRPCQSTHNVQLTVHDSNYQLYMKFMQKHQKSDRLWCAVSKLQNVSASSCFYFNAYTHKHSLTHCNCTCQCAFPSPEPESPTEGSEGPGPPGKLGTRELLPSATGPSVISSGAKKCRIEEEEGGQNEHQLYFSSILLWYHISHPIDINKNRCVISTASHWTKMKPNGSAVNHYVPPIL